MKRPYLHNQDKDNLKPNFVYAARCLFDIEQALGGKKRVSYTRLKTGIFLVRYTD